MRFLKWTIGSKLWFLMFLTVLLTVSMQYLNYQSTVSLSTRVRDLGRHQLPNVRVMTLADMMHDGIRASVYSGIVTQIRKANSDDYAEARKEFAEYSENIQKYIKSLQ